MKVQITRQSAPPSDTFLLQEQDEIRKSGADVTLFLDQLVAVNDHDASVSATDDSGGLELGKNL